MITKMTKTVIAMMMSMMMLPLVCATGCDKEDGGFVSAMEPGDYHDNWWLAVGEAQIISTWHKAESAIELRGDTTVLAQNKDFLNPDEDFGNEFSIMADIVGEATLSVVIDFYELDYTVASALDPVFPAPPSDLLYHDTPVDRQTFEVDADDYDTAKFSISPPPWADTLTINLVKTGPGQVRVTRMNMGWDKSSGTVGRDEGLCDSDTQCTGIAICGLDSFDRRCVVPLAKPLGEDCAVDGECRDGSCCEGRCSSCCESAGCPSERECGRVLPIDPFQCSPAQGLYEENETCFRNADCASGPCVGDGLVEPAGNLCPEDGSPCLSEGQRYGHCE